MLGDDKTVEIQGVYNTLYNATTRPDFKFVVTRYFIDEWVPLLGPSLAWLVVGLRQQCFWNRRRNWCIVDKETLAHETALDERTIERCLKKPLSRWFVIEVTRRYRYRHQLGKKVRDKNRYNLLLDEPLSPRHQLGLTDLLRQAAPTNPDPIEAALAAVQSILAMPKLTDKISYDGKIPKELPRRTILELVEEALSLNLADHAADERVVTLDQHCSKLYNHIVQPNKVYVGWQYYRLEWVRLLGHALAWIIIYLRRRCYWDEATDELRDNLGIYKKDMAAAIGQTTRNLANLLDNPHTPLFLTLLNPSDSRNKPTFYQVRMIDEPLTPDDQQRVAMELRQTLEGNLYGIDPENGQLNLFPIMDTLSSRQNFAYGQAPEKMSTSDPKKRRLDDDSSEKMPQLEPAPIGKNAATLNNDSLIPSLHKVHEQQTQTVVVQSEGVKTLLNDLGVQEPARSKLLSNPDITVTTIGAWYLYAESQPSLFDPRSYVIKRLLANDLPPSEFITLAKLDDKVWDLFEQTAHLLRTGQPPATIIEPELLETFVMWADIYGGLTPDDTRRLLATLTNIAARNPLPDPTLDRDPENPDDQRIVAARKLWQSALDQLQLQMTKQTFNSWLKQTEVLDYRDNVFVVDAKNSYAKDWLENRLLKSIERTLALIAGEPTQVQFVLSE